MTRTRQALIAIALIIVGTAGGLLLFTEWTPENPVVRDGLVMLCGTAQMTGLIWLAIVIGKALFSK